MQIPILSGIFTDGSPEFRTSYPVNLRPVPKRQGISEGYLQSVPGLSALGEASGICRGGINWRGDLYRVMGTDLCRISPAGAVTVLGVVAGTGPVSMDYSFDRLAIAGGGNLYYWDGATFTTVTDTDLGVALDVVFADGYFITTDGEFIVVTELLDPTSVDPLKYGSAEVDPDPVKAVKRVRNEIYAIGRYTIEVFDNVGGTGFPFQVIKGGQAQKGAVGTHACAVVEGGIVVLGGGRNESIGVYITASGAAQKISTREIDILLAGYGEDALSSAVLEVIEDRGHVTLLCHLPGKTLAYDFAASEVAGNPAWYVMASGVEANQTYRGRHFVWCNDQWNAADTASGVFGTWGDDASGHWGNVARWEIGLPVVYNGSRGAVVHSVELVGTFGVATADSVISVQHTETGRDWSEPRFVSAPANGDRGARVRFMRQGMMRQRRMYRFRGDSNGPVSIAACQAEMEPLAW